MLKEARIGCWVVTLLVFDTCRYHVEMLMLCQWLDSLTVVSGLRFVSHCTVEIVAYSEDHSLCIILECLYENKIH
jgi:hypothetical protein